MSNFNDRANFHKVDVTNTTDIESAIEKTIAWCRETRAPLRGVINCAGVATARKVSEGTYYSEPTSSFDSYWLH